MFLDKFADTYSWKYLCSDDSFYEIYTMYLQMNITGGSLHIVLDDGNNSDDSIEFCYNYAKERGDVAGMFIASKLYNVVYEDRELYNWNLIEVE